MSGHLRYTRLTIRLIFRLYHGSLPWTSGGEYLAFYRLVKRLLTAWRGVGLDMLYVFDGKSPSSLYPPYSFHQYSTWFNILE